MEAAGNRQKHIFISALEMKQPWQEPLALWFLAVYVTLFCLLQSHCFQTQHDPQDFSDLKS